MVLPTADQYELTLEEGGVIRLPAELQASLGIPVGDIIQVTVTEPGVLVLKTKLVIPEAAEQLERMMAEQSVTLDELLSGLEETRAELFRERYGNALKKD